MFEKIIGSIRGAFGGKVVVRKRISCGRCGLKFSAETKRIQNLQGRYTWAPIETMCYGCKSAKFLREHHIEKDLAIAYITNRLTEEGKARVNAHCEVCDKCNQMLMDAYAGEEDTFE